MHDTSLKICVYDNYAHPVIVHEIFQVVAFRKFQSDLNAVELQELSSATVDSSL